MKKRVTSTPIRRTPKILPRIIINEEEFEEEFEEESGEESEEEFNFSYLTSLFLYI